MDIFDFTTPTAENSYCVFERKLEENPLICFHITPIENKDSIIKNGFQLRHAAGKLESISFAEKSKHCIEHRSQCYPNQECVIFVVEFDGDIPREGLAKVNMDIYLRDENIEYTIHGYCVVPSEFEYL